MDGKKLVKNHFVSDHEDDEKAFLLAAKNFGILGALRKPAKDLDLAYNAKSLSAQKWQDEHLVVLQVKYPDQNM